MKPAHVHGLLVMDKPRGLTSRDVVNRVLPCFPRGTRLGHAVTLDPLATDVLVRCAGEAVVLAPRHVRVYGIDLLYFDYPRAELEVRCGKGTYIRSLARDLGERLGRGALVETLCSTRVGPFSTADALGVDAAPATVL